MKHVQVVVEGELNFAVVQKLLAESNVFAELAAPPRGRGAIEAKILGYNADAARTPWFVLCDLDRNKCAPSLVDAWLPRPNRHMCFRVAVRSIEAWLLADRALASFLNVSPARLPRDPEQIKSPKIEMRNIARRSRLRKIREGIGGAPDREWGSEYTTMLKEFARDHWDPQRAAERSDSLRRSIAAVERLAGE